MEEDQADTEVRHGDLFGLRNKGGGEMETLIRNHPWETTPLGPMAEWPDNLLTILSTLLSSRFPMFLFWGPGLICFYNDAYRPSLGTQGKHPVALGRSA